MFAAFRSERHSEFVSHVESVAYVLCGDEPINRATFRQIFQAKVVIIVVATFRIHSK